MDPEAGAFFALVGARGGTAPGVVAELDFEGFIDPATGPSAGTRRARVRIFLDAQPAEILLEARVVGVRGASSATGPAAGSPGATPRSPGAAAGPSTGAAGTPPAPASAAVRFVEGIPFLGRLGLAAVTAVGIPMLLTTWVPGPNPLVGVPVALLGALTLYGAATTGAFTRVRSAPPSGQWAAAATLWLGAASQVLGGGPGHLHRPHPARRGPGRRPGHRDPGGGPGRPRLQVAMGRDLSSRHQAPVLVAGPGRPLLVLGPGAEHRISRRMVDLCFVFDTTGSMSDKIEGLVACMVDFVRELASLSLDWRASVVPFGDLTVGGDRIVADLPFTSDREAAERMLREMPRNSGGGNEGESVLEAVEAALAKPYRQGAVKVFVVLTDEPALTGRRTPRTVEGALRRAEVICFVASPPLPYYRSWAEATGGAWYGIGPSLDPSEIVRFLRGLARDVARVASDVHTLAGGSVARYLELPPSHRGGLRRRGER